MNYEILCHGSSVRLKDISDFVRKHATIRSDTVYGLSKRENKDIKSAASHKDKGLTCNDKEFGQPPHAKKPDPKPQPKGVSSAAANNLNSFVVLNVLPVVITSSDNRSLSTYAFLDNGCCTDTLIDQQLNLTLREHQRKLQSLRLLPVNKLKLNA